MFRAIKGQLPTVCLDDCVIIRNNKLKKRYTIDIKDNFKGFRLELNHVLFLDVPLSHQEINKMIKEACPGYFAVNEIIAGKRDK